MFASFLLAFREGLEAALILGILLGALIKFDKHAQRKYVWLGALSGVALSLVAGLLLFSAGAAFEGRAEEIFEGFAMLFAAGLLTWAIVWMRSNSKKVDQELKSGIEQASRGNNNVAIFFIAFLSVFREGIELAIFLIAASINYDRVQVLLGSGIGLTVVILLAVLFFKGLIRLDISRFFRVTSVILVIFAAGLVAHGVHELNEANIIPSLIEHVWDVNYILDENSILGNFLKTLTGYNGNPSLTEVFAYVSYLLYIFLAFRKKPEVVS